MCVFTIKSNCYYYALHHSVPLPSPSQMSALCRRLDELWEENQGSVILFTWIQLLKEEALDFLGIKSPLEVIRGGSKAGGERRKTDPAAAGRVLQ